MNYTFKQLPHRNRKKVLWYFLGTALFSVLFAFGTMWMCTYFAVSEGWTIALFIAVFVITAGISFAWLTQKYAVKKTICILDSGIVITEVASHSERNKQATPAAPTNRFYTLTPDMIRMYRYVSGSDEANHLHLSTYNKEYELIVSEPMKNTAAFYAVKTALEKWVQEHGIANRT